MLSPIVVFDLDGTLVDTAPDLIATLNVVLPAEGLPEIDPLQARSLIGAGIRPLIERALAEMALGISDARTDALYARFLQHYREHLADRSRPFPGVEPALDRLAAQGFLLAVCTNKNEDLARRLLDALGLSHRFAAICGQDTFAVKKPHPDALRQTVRCARGDPGRAAMVGDSATDIRLARAAAVPVVGVDFGYTPVPMAELGPDRCIGHFDALADAVLELMPAPAAATYG